MCVAYYKYTKTKYINLKRVIFIKKSPTMNNFHNWSVIIMTDKECDESELIYLIKTLTATIGRFIVDCREQFVWSNSRLIRV